VAPRDAVRTPARHYQNRHGSHRGKARIVSPHRNQIAVTLSARRTITRLVLSHGRHVVHAKQRRLSPRALRIKVTPAQAAGLSLTATIKRRRYATTIG
jgi:hypothetical protein